MENYRPKYHFTAKKGWINDPNGFCYFKGKYHLFYQFHNDTYPGVMSWGHAVSDDLVKFEELNPVICHDSYYDKDGSWSGSSFVHNDTLYLLYTGHCVNNGTQTQTQNLVFSKDGIVFKKYEGNPVISENDLPKDCTKEDFRDPSIYKYNDEFYCLLGNRSKDQIAQLLLYKSKDLFNWKYERTLISTNELGYMLECPSSSLIDNARLLIMSPQGLKVRGEEFWNVYSSIYMICPKDLKNVNYHKIHEIDRGLDFYAPHIISNGNILISWMYIWERSIPLQELNSEWINAFTLPRELSLKRGKLIQKPLSSLNNYFTNEIKYEGKIKEEKEIKGICGQFNHLHLEFNNGGELTIKVFKKNNNYAEIRYENNYLIIDRNKTLYPIKSYKEEKSSCNYRMVKIPQKPVTLDIYLDRILIEVFINNGEEVMSMSVCHPENFDGITLSSKNGKKVSISSRSFTE